MSKPTTTTSDPRLTTPIPHQPGGLGGINPRHETAGCPTGLADSEQEIVVQQPGGGGAPGTGAGPTPAASPGEGVTEEQVEQSGLDDT
jgi:hypothetical protein